jgi:predicted O-methyltransferase YrrM
MKVYEKYIESGISTKGMAASLEALEYIVQHCKDNSPKSILDLGSGISSACLAKQKFDAKLVTCDDSSEWLEQTKKFFTSSRIKKHDMHVWSDFKGSNQEKFDFIFYDLGRIPVRLENMRDVFEMVSTDGYIFVDDVHKGPVRELSEQLAEVLNFELVGQCDKDEFGRYGYLFKNAVQ